MSTPDWRDPSTWLQQTAGGRSPTTEPVPYRVVKRSGWFEDDKAESSEILVIQSSRLADFVTESFPDPYTRIKSTADGVFIQMVKPMPRYMPPLPRFRTKRVEWDEFVDGMPINPFGANPAAPDGTFHPLTKVTVTYSTEYGEDEADPDDPRTYLEIHGDAAGEFLHVPSARAKWGGDGAANTSITNPATVRIPQTVWSLRWTQIPFTYFNGSLIATLRSCLGKVNSTPMPLLYSSPAETVLFAGFNYTEQRTWRTTSAPSQPPITLDIKLVEKQIDLGGTIVGHNHFFRPDRGTFDRLLIDGTNSTYRLVELNNLFRVLTS